MSILKINNLSKSYNNINILENFSLDLKEKEIISIIGPSGVGKTTLLRCINGLEKIDSGNIEVTNKQNKLEIGLVFQDYNLFPQYTVLKNVLLPLTKVLKINKESAINTAKKILEQFNLKEKENSFPFQLSGGEKQRLAIARTLAINPKIICFDEPTSALDPKLVKQVYKIIKQLSEEGKGILIVTHDLSFANKISDRIIELKR